MEKIVILTIFLLVSTCIIFAENNPIQISLITPVQIVPMDQSVSGLRLNLIYGENTFVKGIDIGVINHTTSGQSVGFQHGIVGLNNKDFLGVQLNAINITNNNFEGCQWGIVNYLVFANGLQLGLFNYAGKLKGLQIGILNVINMGGAFPFFPIVNWSF